MTPLFGRRHRCRLPDHTSRPSSAQKFWRRPINPALVHRTRLVEFEHDPRDLLREYISRRPFVPFRIKLIDGETLDVVRTNQAVAMTARMWFVTPRDTLRWLRLEQIEFLQCPPPLPHLRRTFRAYIGAEIRLSSVPPPSRVVASWPSVLRKGGREEI